MIKKLCCMMGCLIPLMSSAAEEKCTPDLKTVSHENMDVLRKATDRYLHFIDQISQGKDFPQLEASSKILSPNVKKILNGQLFTQNRDDFVNDLLSVYANQGAWKIDPVDMIIDSTTNTVVLRIFIQMEKSGSYTAIVILRYDSNYSITEINEVLNEVKGSYDFKK